jgi:PKD repeat protein
MNKNVFFKITLLVSLILLSVGCSKEASAPIFDFSYAVKGLTVQFSTTSIDATSFKWDFGDGTNSTDKNPIHTYLATNNYFVSLTASGPGGTSTISDSVEVIKPEPIIIDGSFGDWDSIPAANLAIATLPANAPYTALQILKVYADKNYIYLYMKFDSTNMDPVDIYLDADAKVTTGADLSQYWANSGADLLIEGSLSGKLQDAPVYQHDDSQGPSAWAWNTIVNAGIGAINMSKLVTVNGSVVECEVSIIRGMIPFSFSNPFNIGVVLSFTSWSEAGVLPINSKNDPSVPMLSVKVN